MTGTIEVLKFEVDPERAERFAEGRAAVNAHVRANVDGYLGSLLVRTAPDTWYLIIEFADVDAEHQAVKWIAGQPVFAEWTKLARRRVELSSGPIEVDDRVAGQAR